ncbi:GNAT family N-acetyltransferase [Chloroflexota bacterium]
MIYYSVVGNIRDTAELYEEWLGHKPLFKGVALNEEVYGAYEGYGEYSKEKRKLVGALQVFTIADRIHDRNFALIENVYVLKDYRQKGIAKGLMEFTAKCLEISGYEISFVKLTSRKEIGKKLYRSLGYEEGSSFRKVLTDNWSKK